jgi:hypothetical protein
MGSSRAGHRLGDAGRRGARGPVALAEMVHDALDHAWVGDEADDSHLGSTATTHQRLNFVHSPDMVYFSGLGMVTLVPLESSTSCHSP